LIFSIAISRALFISPISIPPDGVLNTIIADSR
jgi:hypothetical protein